MSNEIVPANAEAMPSTHAEAWRKIRQFSRELSAALAEAGDCSAVHVCPTGSYFPILFANANAETDPLLETIKDYKAGCVAFQTFPDETPEAESEAAAATYMKPMEALANWKTPAGSREGVIAALELLKSDRLLVGPLGPSLVNACISFLKGETL